MKPTFLLIAILALACTVATGQSIDRQLIGAGGLVTNNASIDIESSIGEALVGDLTNSSNEFNQGFQQADDLITSLNDQLSGGFTVYPNPFSNYLSIETDMDVASIRLFDMKGTLVADMNYSNHQSVDLSFLSAGLYQLVLLSNQSNDISTYQIQKN